MCSSSLLSVAQSCTALSLSLSLSLFLSFLSHHIAPLLTLPSSLSLSLSFLCSYQKSACLCEQNKWITFQKGVGEMLGETTVLQKVFLNGTLLIDQTMDEIRARAAEGLLDGLPTLTFDPVATPEPEAQAADDAATLEARIAAAKETLAALEAQRV